MREITLFWKRARLVETDIAPMLEIVTSAVFVAYIKRTPNDIRMLMKTSFKPGRKPEDLNSLYFLELLEIHYTPETDSESYMLNVRLSHPLSNFNARTNGTTAVPGCRLDQTGLTYIIQGGNIRLRLVAAMARLMAKPDRISARNLDLNATLNSGPLSQKQLKLVKFAYDKGWYNPSKKVRISEMSEELGLARATLAEHLSRIESIVMDDLLGSFSNIRINYDDYSMLKEMVESDSETLGYSTDNNFKKLLTNMHTNMNLEKIKTDKDDS
ncbi:MAG: hypothetical protein HOE76_05070 [Euryarchaeota archaeon]|jgi:hypothetical protein|nr:hypothetical protein [Euryarchaeota archaeon]MBT4982176.1 hypothetical protein [Euryarchaeota archaeon]MBT5184495.1 hypothetical protein [Euryarchaeota archaeon]